MSPPNSSHLLFVRNLPYTLTPPELLCVFEKYGAISGFNLQIRDKGVAYIAYFDSRCAAAAVAGLRDLVLGGRRAFVSQCSAPPADAAIAPHVLTARVTLQPPLPFRRRRSATRAVRNRMGAFGEVRAASSSRDSVAVDFYDTRSAMRALQQSSYTIEGVCYRVLNTNINTNCCAQCAPPNPFPAFGCAPQYPLPPPPPPPQQMQMQMQQPQQPQMQQPQRIAAPAATPEQLRALAALQELVAAN